jgi:fructose PTS system EIIA component
MITSEVVGTLSDYTRPGLIIPQLRERDTAGVVKELSQVLHQEGCVPDLLAFYNAAMNHEFLVNSATGFGLALPHARLNGVLQTSFAFGHSQDPLQWGGRPTPPVQFVFLLAVPATDAAGFLQLLSALARFGQQEELLLQLGSEHSPEGILDLFNRIKVRQA